MAEHSRWTREETIIALYYYFQIPYGQLTQNNPKILYIAKLLDRTPSSVCMKMGNLARFDKTLQARGVHGLSNGSRMDDVIWHEFYNHYDSLVTSAETALNRLKEENNDSLFNTIPSVCTPADPYAEGMTGKFTPKRNTEIFFSQAVLASYDSKCCMTGIAIPELIGVCHIKPVRDCTSEEEKITPQNGLCMNALFKDAFQSGLISIRSDNLSIIVSPRLKKHKRLDSITKSWIVDSEGRKIITPHHCMPHKLFLEYHNDVIFKGSI